MGKMVIVVFKNGDVKKIYNVVNVCHYPNTKEFVVSSKEYEDTPYTPLGIVHRRFFTDALESVSVRTDYVFSEV